MPKGLSRLPGQAMIGRLLRCVTFWPGFLFVGLEREVEPSECLFVVFTALFSESAFHFSYVFVICFHPCFDLVFESLFVIGAVGVGERSAGASIQQVIHHCDVDVVVAFENRWPKVFIARADEEILL